VFSADGKAVDMLAGNTALRTVEMATGKEIKPVVPTGIGYYPGLPRDQGMGGARGRARA